MARYKKQVSKTITIILCFVAVIIGVFAGAVGQIYCSLPLSYSIPTTQTCDHDHSVQTGEINVEEIKNDALSIHFLELGNKYTGDCTLIKVGNTEVLIDAGSKASSIPTLSSYINNYCTDGVLEYVVVTHAHEDHYAGFATSASVNSIFDIYECENIIEFAKTNKLNTATMQANYIRERNAEVSNGANCYTALECVNETNGAQKVFDLGNDVELEILNSFYYTNEAETENDYSVCLMINYNAKHYLFTGDLEEDGEAYLVSMNTLPIMELYKAGHHGSKTSSSDALLSVIQPKIVCVCCCAGSTEYTKNNDNTFPTQQFVDRIAPYTTKVFVTTLCVDYKAGNYSSMNGNIVVRCNLSDIVVSCSNNNVLLKDTDWFKTHRTMPTAWESSGV